MEFQFFGANCIRINTKKTVIVIDDTIADFGLKSVVRPGDVAVYTTAHGLAGADVKLVVDQPGEYEVADISVQGIAARAHIDEPGQKNAVIYKIMIDDTRIAVLGNIFPELSGSQLEAIGMVDVLFVPVGGNGYSIDGVGALKLIKDIEPKIVIPTHYHDPAIKYPVPQRTLDEALKEIGIEPTQRVAKLKLKPGEVFDTMQLIVLERQ